jgi:hypothetical protein
MDAKKLIRVAVAGQGEQAGWNNLSAQCTGFDHSSAIRS